MRGPVSLNVSDNKVEYSIKLYHNINILTGDGGKGKSSLINLILRSLQKDGFTKLESNVEVRILDMVSYFYFLRETPSKKDHILYVIDEEVLRVKNQNFINKVYDTGCFFLFITRAFQRVNLLISTDAIYKLKTIKDSLKYKNTLQLLYEKPIGGVKPISEIITEDKVSAPDMLRKVGYNRINPAGSNTQVQAKLSVSKYKNIALFVDFSSFWKEHTRGFIYK